MFSRKAFFALFAATIPVVRSATIDVQVGGPGVLKFNPEFVNANVGDVLRFTFKQKNHTVTQSSLEAPCSPLADGVDSGFIPVADSVTSGFPVAEMTIDSTDPIWMYCRQGNHCQQGMVFAVNPGDKFGQFKAAATGNAASPSASASGAATATATVSGGQTTTSSSGSSAPTAATSTDHRVVVGGPGKLTYEPSNINAQVGDTVTFEFRQKNHTVTQSTFDNPCRALSLTSTTGQIGFDSGFMAVADDATNFPTYTIQINDTKPIWAYCRQGNHCGSGMVFSVNAVAPNTFDAFKAKAMQINGTASNNTATSTPENAAASSRLSAGTLALAVAGALLGSFF
ncbi:hypothetical protein Moror_8289 [Moniliophthora roreri MCA 2997]|uniref:Cupredoxin n=2 Tax=Moniliophthora roreri TaxID=221103 RepID=V2YRL2_MONRO|nr:hypothetical protein Moror_8289 [Moniliophthora roreri MCA 2997]